MFANRSIKILESCILPMTASGCFQSTTDLTQVLLLKVQTTLSTLFLLISLAHAYWAITMSTVWVSQPPLRPASLEHLRWLASKLRPTCKLSTSLSRMSETWRLWIKWCRFRRRHHCCPHPLRFRRDSICYASRTFTTTFHRLRVQSR